MTTSSTTEVGAASSTFHSTSWSRTPRSTPARKAPDIERMPTMTAAARAGSRTVGPATAVSGTPSVGARSTTVRAARPPATDHSSSESWLTGMPSSRARSMFSAMPRTAMPASVRSRNHDSTARTIGTTASSSRSLPVKVTGPTLTVESVSEVSTCGMNAGASSQVGR